MIVKEIAAKPKRVAPKKVVAAKLKRVAAYARVSSDHEEQLNSYEVQVNYYTDYINNHQGWKLVGVYADEGISGTQVKTRKSFNQMVKDALDGKIDLIITKSFSRFARNTVDCLVTIRKLKAIGVEIFFEKENVWTLDSKGELLITIMSSLAQEESRNISENVTWGHRRRFAEGKVIMCYGRFLGYEKGENGSIAINEEQAKVVRRIYADYLAGASENSIAKAFTEEGVPTPAGSKKWYSTVVASILRNEKYKGDALLQKYVTPDFMTHTPKKNCGDAPQYYVEGSHPAIIDAKTFDRAQLEYHRRSMLKGEYSTNDKFMNKVFCAECGYNYTEAHINSHGKKIITYYRCSHRYQANPHCKSKSCHDYEIIKVFEQKMKRMLANKDELVKVALAEAEQLENTEALDKEHQRIIDKIESISSKSQDEVAMAKIGRLEKKLERCQKALEENAFRATSLRWFAETLLQSKDAKWSPEVWQGLVDRVVIDAEGNMDITMRNN